MSNIRNITELRDHALETLEALDRGDIDVHQAGVTGKLYEAVISSLKTQLAYAEIRQEVPQIDFIDGHSRKTINIPSTKLEVKALTQKRKVLTQKTITRKGK